MSDGYGINTIVPSHFDPSIVAASYFASLCGTILTIELLNRRGTALGNLRSWLETFSCAVSFGVVGIWCMHFIGNRAIILGNGDPSIQLVYNPRYTVLSVFCPILGLMAAFSAAERQSKTSWAHWASLILTGLLAGASIAGMHYVANYGITNYSLKYRDQFLAASIIIAVGDCEIVLVLFYTLREKWISSWWKRLLCAMFLAGGVSAMHFTAATNCTYMLKHTNDKFQMNARNTQVIIAGSICGAAAATILVYLSITRRRAEARRQESRKVMLACVTFDSSGRVMVTTQGALPSRQITDKYNHRTFDEDFSTAHPVFQWIFRVTHNWNAVGALVERMRSHLKPDIEGDVNDSTSGSSLSSTMYDPDTYSNYSIIFRERFCTAAASLAASMYMPLDRMGVMYDKIVETGTLQTQEAGRHGLFASMRDIEAALRENVFGKGQVMFLIRQTTGSEDVDNLLNAGFKFASRQHISRTAASAMQISVPALESHLAGIKRQLESYRECVKSGTWLALFALMPKANQKGFDVAVNKNCPSQLPDVQILSTKPNTWQLDFLSMLDGCKVDLCIAILNDRLTRQMSCSDSAEVTFARTLRDAILRLGTSFPNTWFRHARFSPLQMSAYYANAPPNRANTTTLYAFTVICDLHFSLDSSAPVTRVPLSFFDARQRCYPGSPDHAILQKDIHHMFSPLLAKQKPRDSSNKAIVHWRPSIPRLHSSKEKQNPLPTLSTMQRKSERSSRDETWSEPTDSVYELDEVQLDNPGPFSRHASLAEQRHHSSHWGGILVSSETMVRSNSPNESPSHDSRELGTSIAIGVSKPETTFVDQLVTICKAYSVPNKPGSSRSGDDMDHVSAGVGGHGL